MIDTRKLAVISTGHVSKETAELFNSTHREKWPACGGPFNVFGWFMYIDPYADDTPDDLKIVFTYLDAQGFEYVLFDCDASCVTDLPLFEW
jgi:hypothetical protein